MHTNLKQKLFIYVFMFAMFILMDFITTAVIFREFTIKYPLLEIGIILIALAPIFLFKSNRYSIIYSSVIFGVFLILMVVNLTLNYASNDIYSTKYISLLFEAAQVMTTEFINPWYILVAALLVAIFITYLILIYRLFKYHIPENKIKRRRYYPLAMSITIIFLALGISFRTIGLSEVEEDNKDLALYSNMNGSEILEAQSTTFKRGAIKKYGMYTYLGAEISSIFITDSEKNEVEKYFSNGDIVNEDITDDFSGLCKDMNVITIMIETGVDFTINEELTPTLYKLKNEGVDFTNNHSKNKTNISEIIGIVGSVAKVGVTKDYNTPATMPNMLNNMGYTSSYFHNNDKTFYNRDKLIKSMGFTNQYFKDDIDPNEIHDFIKADYPLDAYFMNGLKSGTMSNLSDRLADIDGIVDKIVPDGDEKFYSFWTTMSTHGPYNTSTRNMKYYEDLGYVDKIKSAEAKGLWKNICADDNINIQNQIINFQCEMMDLDLAVSALIERLEETNKLDNTLLILYGDHEPYYMCNDEISLKYAVYNTEDPCDPKLFSTTLIMYNNKLNQKYEEVYGNTSYDKFSSTYNIVPTILDLVGAKYNENYYVGKSVFLVENELENIFYSHELESIFSDKLYCIDYDDFEYKDSNIDDNYLNDFKKYGEVETNKIKIFNRFYEKKLYSYMK